MIRRMLSAVRPAVVALFIAGLLTAVALPCSAEVTINWKDHGEAREISKSSGKMQLIYFYGDYCVYCAKMSKETLSNSEVVAYVNENFIASKIDTEKDKDMSAVFHVRSLPQTAFVQSNGGIVATIPGYMKPSLFLWLLKYFHSESQKTMNFMEFLKQNNASSVMGGN